MRTKKKPIDYIVAIMFWRETPKADINEAIKARREFVKKLRLGGTDMVWQGSGNADKGKPSLGNLSFHLWFKKRVDWQKALKKMDADKRFEFRPVKSSEIHKRYRGYRFIEKTKVRVGK